MSPRSVWALALLAALVGCDDDDPGPCGVETFEDVPFRACELGGHNHLDVSREVLGAAENALALSELVTGSLFRLPDGHTGCGSLGALRVAPARPEDPADVAAGQTYVFDFQRCRDAQFGGALDGRVSLVIERLDGPPGPGRVLEGRLELDALSVELPDGPRTLDGALALRWTQHEGEDRKRLEAGDDGWLFAHGGVLVEARNATLERVRPVAGGAYLLDWNGQLSLKTRDAAFEAVLETLVPFEGRWGQAPGVGQLELRAGDGSGARIGGYEDDATGLENHASYFVDGDADGAYETGPVLIDWRFLVAGALFGLPPH